MHKRVALTEEGYFAGIQHPMAMVIRKRDMKLISVSTKKIKVYESAYVAPLESKPVADFEHGEIVRDRNDVGDCTEPEVPGPNSPADSIGSSDKPQHVF